MKRTFALAAMFAALAVPAQAADLLGSSLKDGTDYERSWTGFSVGIHGAYDWANTDGSTNIPGVAMSGDSEGSFRPGVHVRYDVQLGRMVAGAFADFTAGARNLSGTASAGPIAVGLEAEVESQWTVGGRLGYLVTNRTLVYGLAGYTWARTSDLDLNLAGLTLASVPVSDLSGLVLGAGLERELGGGFSFTAEYRHAWLDDAKATLAPGASLGLGGSQHSIRAGLSYRF